MIYGDGSDETAGYSRARVFLSVLDAGFNLVGEVEVKELFTADYKYFAKDGKLWVCQNFSDELGFLVFDFYCQWLMFLLTTICTDYHDFFLGFFSLTACQQKIASDQKVGIPSISIDPEPKTEIEFVW